MQVEIGKPEKKSSNQNHSEPQSPEVDPFNPCTDLTEKIHSPLEDVNKPYLNAAESVRAGNFESYISACAKVLIKYLLLSPSTVAKIKQFRIQLYNDESKVDKRLGLDLLV